MIRNGKIDLVLNTLTYGKHPERDGFNLRRMAVELAVPCLTSLDTAREVLRVFANKARTTAIITSQPFRITIWNKVTGLESVC